MIDLDPKKHGDIAALQIDSNGQHHTLIFIASRLRAVYCGGSSFLLVSCDFPQLWPEPWHEWALYIVGLSGIDGHKKIRHVDQQVLDNILHVKSLRTVQHELSQNGNGHKS
jgi:hypothetical protein